MSEGFSLWYQLWSLWFTSATPSPLLVPWLCGAPLTALLKKNGGFRPIAVGEILCRLASRLCCQFACPFLSDFFLPFGQVGVGVSQVALRQLSMHTYFMQS